MYLEEQLLLLTNSINDIKKSIEISHNPIRESRTYSIKISTKDELLTTSEIAKLLKSNKNYVGELLKSGLLPYMQLGSRKVRRTSFELFLQKYEGWDLSIHIIQNQLLMIVITACESIREILYK